MAVSVSVKLEAFLGGNWVDIWDDAAAAAGPLVVRYGIQGNSPADASASPGEMVVSLRNDTSNSGGVLGYYSVNHANKRSGWGFGVAIRVRLTSGATTDRVKFIGKVGVIDPEPGLYLNRRVHVVAYDGIYDLLNAEVSALTAQSDETEDTLIDEVLDAVDASAAPVARNLDPGVDTVPYAFYDLGTNDRALGLVHNIALSTGGLVFTSGDGTFTYLNRQTRSTSASQFTFADTMQGLLAPSSLDEAWTRVRATFPQVVVADTPEPFYTVEKRGTLAIPQMALGETQSIFVTYFTSGDGAIDGAIAALDVAIDESSTEYFSDGLGTVPCFSVTSTFFATTCKLDVTYLAVPFGLSDVASWPVAMTLELSGRIVTDLGDGLVNASVTRDYSRLLPLHLPFQHDSATAQALADFIVAQFADLSDQITAIEFVANRSDALMQQALTREPGDRITVQEAVTGLSADAVIHGVELSLSRERILTCRWGLAPATPWSMWSLGDDSFTELGEATVLGF